MNISILPLSTSNIGSICRALEICDKKFEICSKDSLINSLKNSDCLIIPGVGAYDKASEYLHTNDLIKPIKKFASSGRIMIGI